MTALPSTTLACSFFPRLLGALPTLTPSYSLYTLVFKTHKGWYSWGLSSLVSLVYGMGFVMMTPQLFINYKLKSGRL